MKMTDTEEITQELVKFRNERDWGQFHNPKELAIALNIEAAELLELFIWKNSEEADINDKPTKKKVKAFDWIDVKQIR